MTDFRCSSCGKLLSVDAAPAEQVTCPHCQAEVDVPEGLSSLPNPQVPSSKASAQTPPKSPSEPPKPTRPGERPAAVPPEAARAQQQAEQGEPAEDEEEEEEQIEESPLMAAMAAAMPWVISVFFHVGLIFIMSFAVLLVYSQTEDDKVKRAMAADFENDIQAVNFGEMNPDLMNTQPTPTEEKKWAREADDSLADTGKTENVLDAVGVGPGGSSAGALARQGTTLGGGGLPTTFLGQRAKADDIVYVIDRSGSMLTTFRDLKYRMLRSIADLEKSQQFHVILFSSGEPLEPEPRRLKPAIDQYKRNTATFLQKLPAEGQTNPLPALDRAFDVLRQARSSERVSLIHLLTDADFPNNDAVEKAIDRLNRDKKVNIFTYLYGYTPDPTFENFMKKIAKENGGQYKYVSPDE